MANPVLVVGMHRSGTSLVSRILDDCGVMMGKDLQEDHESLFFIGLNEWIYENAGASWERPGALSELTTLPVAMEAIEEYVRKRLSSRSSRKYSGKPLKNGLFSMEGRWGWKDPRNGPSLPLWRSIWPDMKVIHVIRHGADVAASLRMRNSTHWEGDVSRCTHLSSRNTGEETHWQELQGNASQCHGRNRGHYLFHGERT